MGDTCILRTKILKGFGLWNGPKIFVGLCVIESHLHDPPLPLRGWWTVLGFEWIQFANGAKGEIFMNTIQDSDREREKERLKGNIHEGRL